MGGGERKGSSCVSLPEPAERGECECGGLRVPREPQPPASPLSGPLPSRSGQSLWTEGAPETGQVCHSTSVCPYHHINPWSLFPRKGQGPAGSPSLWALPPPPCFPFHSLTPGGGPPSQDLEPVVSAPQPSAASVKVGPSGALVHWDPLTAGASPRGLLGEKTAPAPTWPTSGVWHSPWAWV